MLTDRSKYESFWRIRSGDSCGLVQGGKVTSTEVEIRRVLSSHARLPIDADRIDVDADLYQSGMTSHASVNVMLGLEEAFDIEFPDVKLRKSTFASITAIRETLEELGAEAPTG